MPTSPRTAAATSGSGTPSPSGGRDRRGGGGVWGRRAAGVVGGRRAGSRELMPYIIATVMGVSVFFTLLRAVVSSPFARLAFAPPDGQGLNPLLQNPGMFFHPPPQYLGYVGLTIPLAFAPPP